MLPKLDLAAAPPPNLVISEPMREALQLWLSYRDDYVVYGVAPIAKLEGKARQDFIDPPWASERAKAIGWLTKYTDRLLSPNDWYQRREDAQILSWVMDHFYGPTRLPSTEWAREHYADWDKRVFHLAYMANAQNGHDWDDHVTLERCRYWRLYVEQLSATPLPI